MISILDKSQKITLQIREDLKGYLRDVVPGGFEPPLTEPKTVVLPLHHRTINRVQR